MSNKHNKNQNVENIEENATQPESNPEETIQAPKKASVIQRGKTWCVEQKEGIKKHAKRVAIATVLGLGALVGVNEYTKRNGSDDLDGECEGDCENQDIPDTETVE